MSVNLLLSAANQTISSSGNEPLLTDWILVVVTAILVCVTIFYAFQTWRLVRVPFVPALMVTLQSTFTSVNNRRRIDIEVENIGVGTAVAINGNYSIRGLNRVINIPILRPNERSQRIGLADIPHIENKDRSFYQANPTMIEITLNFRDILNYTFNFNVTQNVSEFAINAPDIF